MAGVFSEAYGHVDSVRTFVTDAISDSRNWTPLEVAPPKTFHLPDRRARTRPVSWYTSKTWRTQGVPA